MQYQYSLSAIRAAAINAGLSEHLFAEHYDVSCDLCTDTLKLEADGCYRRRVKGSVKPALFTLIVERRS